MVIIIDHKQMDPLGHHCLMLIEKFYIFQNLINVDKHSRFDFSLILSILVLVRISVIYLFC